MKKADQKLTLDYQSAQAPQAPDAPHTDTQKGPNILVQFLLALIGEGLMYVIVFGGILLFVGC